MDKESEKGTDIRDEKTKEEDVTQAEETKEDKDKMKELSPSKEPDENCINTDQVIDKVGDSPVQRSDSKDEKLDYGMSLLQDSIYFDNDIQVRPELVESLTAGFTEKFLPSLERNRRTIGQIKSSQAVLIETVQQENAKFEECQANKGLEKTMVKAKVYHAKLLKLRKDMTALYEKSGKLKRRALRLQQHKQKEELTRAQQMEVEYEKEKMLTARVATGSPEKET